MTHPSDTELDNLQRYLDMMYKTSGSTLEVFDGWRRAVEALRLENENLRTMEEDDDDLTGDPEFETELARIQQQLNDLTRRRGY